MKIRGVRYFFSEAFKNIFSNGWMTVTSIFTVVASLLVLGVFLTLSINVSNMAGNLENVGYAKEGKAGIYNILIMEEKHTILALGAGASTKIVFPDGKRIERIENVKSLYIFPNVYFLICFCLIMGK